MSEKKRPTMEEATFVLGEIVNRMSIFEADTLAEYQPDLANMTESEKDYAMNEREYHPNNGLIQARLALHDLMSALSEYHRILASLE